MNSSKLLTLTAGALLCSNAYAIDYSFYGSIRFAAESVSPDTGLGSYGSWRDAYSRIGVRASHKLSDSTTALATFELPFDIPNKAVQDPWNQSEDIRVAKAGIKGDFGNLSVGQMWMPYYNAIAYPVDMFSTYYSGFATYTTFRKGDTLSYYSPAFGNLSFGAAYSVENGAADNNGDADDRIQLTASYGMDGLTLSAGIDDLGGANDASILGVSMMYQVSDALYLGAKYETHSSDLNSGYGADGDAAANICAGYTAGKNTYKAMLAQVDAYGEQIIHLGIDHQYSDSLKFFVEYYSEEETAAITTKHGGAAETCWSCSGGDVIAAGLRYDFSSK